MSTATNGCGVCISGVVAVSVRNAAISIRMTRSRKHRSRSVSTKKTMPPDLPHRSLDAHRALGWTTMPIGAGYCSRANPAACACCVVGHVLSQRPPSTGRPYLCFPGHHKEQRLADPTNLTLTATQFTGDSVPLPAGTSRLLGQSPLAAAVALWPRSRPATLTCSTSPNAALVLER